MITTFATRILLCAVLTASMSKPVERCEFGNKCYRKDKSHFKKFSHPDSHQWFVDGKDGISYPDETLPPKQTAEEAPRVDEADQRRVQEEQAEQLRIQNDLLVQQQAEAAALLVQKEKEAEQLRAQQEEQLRIENAKRDEELRIQQEEKDAAIRAQEEKDAALRVQQAHEAEQIRIQQETEAVALRVQEEKLRVQQEARDSDNQVRIDDENRLRLQAAEEAKQLRIQMEKAVGSRWRKPLLPKEQAAHVPTDEEAAAATVRLVADDTAQDHTAQADQLPTQGDAVEADRLPTQDDASVCAILGANNIHAINGTPCVINTHETADPLPTQDNTTETDQLAKQDDTTEAGQLETQDDTTEVDQHPTQDTMLCSIQRFLGTPCVINTPSQREFLIKRAEAEIDAMSPAELVAHKLLWSPHTHKINNGDEVPHDLLTGYSHELLRGSQTRSPIAFLSVDNGDEIDWSDHTRDLKQFVKDHIKTLVEDAHETDILDAYNFDGLSAAEQEAASNSSK